MGQRGSSCRLLVAARVLALAWFELACGGRSSLLEAGSNAAEAGGGAAAVTVAGAGSGATDAGGATVAVAGAAAVSVPLVEPKPGDACAVRQVAGDSLHTCAVTEAHELHCWGDNSFYQLGDGTQVDRLTPGPSVMSGVRTVAVTGGMTCAVKWTGELLCWGKTAGLLGEPSLPAPLTQHPSQVTSGVIDVGLSTDGTCVLTSTGGLRCWGSAFDGISGVEAHVRCWGALYQRDTAPDVSVDRDLMQGARSVLAVNTRACAITTDGALYCWGQNNHGELGDGRVDPVHPIMVRVPERIAFCP